MLSAAVFVMAACSLGRADEAPELTEVLVVPTLNLPLTLQPTPITFPTQTQPPPPTNVINPPVSCVPRTDWPIYTVVPGDTLSNIASRTQTTAQALISANCLANPDVLNVGQRLYVPRSLNPTNTPAPTLTPAPTQTPVPQMVGSIGVSQQISGDAGNILLLRGAPSVVEYNGAPFGISRVRFYLIRAGTMQLIGTDDNPQDGFRAVWVVPPSLDGHTLQAYGYNVNDQLMTVSSTLAVYSAQPPGQGCRITFNAPTNYFAQPHEPSQPAIGNFATGSSTEVVGRSLGGWWAFDTSNSNGANGVEALGYIPVNANVTPGTGC